MFFAGLQSLFLTHYPFLLNYNCLKPFLEILFSMVQSFVCTWHDKIYMYCFVSPFQAFTDIIYPLTANVLTASSFKKTSSPHYWRATKEIPE